MASSLSDTDLNGAANAARGKEVAFVFITADSGYVCASNLARKSDIHCSEGYITVEGNAGDRNDLSAWHNGVSTTLFAPVHGN